MINQNMNDLVVTLSTDVETTAIAAAETIKRAVGRKMTPNARGGFLDRRAVEASENACRHAFAARDSICEMSTSKVGEVADRARVAASAINAMDVAVRNAADMAFDAARAAKASQDASDASWDAVETKAAEGVDTGRLESAAEDAAEEAAMSFSEAVNAAAEAAALAEDAVEAAQIMVAHAAWAMMMEKAAE